MIHLKHYMLCVKHRQGWKEGWQRIREYRNLLKGLSQNQDLAPFAMVNGHELERPWIEVNFDIDLHSTYLL